MNTLALHCLILSPSNPTKELIEHSLQNQFDNFRITNTTNLHDAIMEVESSHFNIALLVLDPLQDDHHKLFGKLKSIFISLPTVMIANNKDLDVLIGMLDDHADRYEIIEARGLTENTVRYSMLKAIRNHESTRDLERLKKEFQGSLTKNRGLPDKLPDLVFICDRSGKLLDINETALQFFGISREKILLRPIFEVLGLNRGDFDMLLSRAVAQEEKAEAFEIEYRPPNGGGAVFGKTHLIHDDDPTNKDRPIEFQGVIRDITPQKALERQLRESEDQHRTLYQLARICSSSLRLTDVVDQSLEMIHHCFHAKGSMLLMNQHGENLNLIREFGMPKSIRDSYASENPPILGQDLIGRLAISSGIITDHHGRFEVESEEGMGTTFRIYLPSCVNDSSQANIISIENTAD